MHRRGQPAIADLARSARFEHRLGLTGVTLFGARTDGEAAIEVRTFTPSCGRDEDLVCAIGNGSVAVFRHLNEMLVAGGDNYVAAQGRRLVVTTGSRSASDAAGKVMIGGACVTCLDGTLRDQ